MSSTPKYSHQVEALGKMFNIRTVITLTEEEPLPVQWFATEMNMELQVRNVFIPVPNYHPPSLEQMDAICEMVRNSVCISRHICNTYPMLNTVFVLPNIL